MLRVILPSIAAHLLTGIRLAIGINWIVPIGALGYQLDGFARWLHARWTHG